jgi:murein endopeptidase
VVFVLAGLRSGGEPRTKTVGDNPPSLTLRLGAGTFQSAVGSVHLSGASATPALPARVHGVAQADAAAGIDWHRATSVGLPYGGSLVDGTQLPVEGPSWVTWNPVTDSVPNAPRRLYGNERTIRAIVSVTEAYRAANPGAPRVVVGDISREGGGPMRDEHVSHQNGLDVDIYFPRLDGKVRAPLAPGEIDHRLAQDLVDRFVAAGAQMIFVGYSTGLHGPAGVVVPYSSHENHMHVRFPPPGG